MESTELRVRAGLDDAYILMGVAAWLVWKQDRFQAAKISLLLFGVQLICNVGWSWIFFGLHQSGGAFAETRVLWVAIAATVIAFFKTSQSVAWLMQPYWASVTFASALNFAIWRLN